MYGSVVAWQFKPGSHEQVLRSMRDIFLPALSKQPGFRRVSLIQTGENAMTSVIVYDSQEEADPAFTRMADLVREHLGSMVEGMQRSAGQVVLEEPY